MNRDARMRGFTLVEVVIALTLLALIMMGLVTALSTFGNTASRLERRVVESDDVVLVLAFLQQALGAASPRAVTSAADATSAVALRGDETSLVWLGLMPARHGVGGLHYMSLNLEPGEHADQLVLRYLPFDPGAEGPEWADAREHLLLAGVSRFSLTYQPIGVADWLADWLDKAVLPGRIAIALAVGDTAWPTSIIRVLAAEPSSDLDGLGAGDGEGVPER